jgi:hypothetical protein
MKDTDNLYLNIEALEKIIDEAIINQ